MALRQGVLRLRRRPHCWPASAIAAAHQGVPQHRAWRLAAAARCRVLHAMPPAAILVPNLTSTSALIQVSCFFCFHFIATGDEQSLSTPLPISQVGKTMEQNNKEKVYALPNDFVMGDSQVPFYGLLCQLVQDFLLINRLPHVPDHCLAGVYAKHACGHSNTASFFHACGQRWCKAPVATPSADDKRRTTIEPFLYLLGSTVGVAG